MTTDELIALSKRVAEKLGIQPQILHGYAHQDGVELVWLHEDSARCFELMCEHEIDVGYTGAVVYIGDSILIDIEEYYISHNKDRAIATRVAILKALEAL